MKKTTVFIKTSSFFIVKFLNFTFFGFFCTRKANCLDRKKVKWDNKNVKNLSFYAKNQCKYDFTKNKKSHNIHDIEGIFV